MIATAVIILVVIFGVNHSSAFEGMSKGKRALIQFAILFAALFILNIFWPYGSGMFTDLFVHRTTSMLKATGLRFIMSRARGTGRA